jgi:hypothetical protein
LGRRYENAFLNQLKRCFDDGVSAALATHAASIGNHRFIDYRYIDNL